MAGKQREFRLYDTSSPVKERLALISRFAEQLRRLSRLTDRIGRGKLGTELMEVACCMGRISCDLAISDYGTIIIGRAAGLVGAVEAVVEREAKSPVLH